MALAVLGLMLHASSAWAAPSVKIRMINQIGGEPVEITSDVQPETKNGRVMVPLRAIGEQLGAEVRWTGKEAVLAWKGKTITLRPNSDKAMVNGETVRLDAKPYVRNNRVMVPLRFVAEAFDCSVRYADRTVTITTKPLVIDGVAVASLQRETRMINSGFVDGVVGNSHIEGIYHLFAEHLDDKVEAPARYDWYPDLDTPGSYYLSARYDFLDRDGNSVKRFDVYAPSLGVTEEEGYLMHAVLEDQWYRIGSEAVQKIRDLIETASRSGYVISRPV